MGRPMSRPTGRALGKPSNVEHKLSQDLFSLRIHYLHAVLPSAQTGAWTRLPLSAGRPC